MSDTIHKRTADCILASSSPRRRELIQELGLDFRIVVPGYDEGLTTSLDPVVHAKTNALEKGRWVSHRIVGGRSQPQLIVSADTIGVVDGVILNKPSSPDDSFAMLTSLSGRAHTVMTAIALFFRREPSASWQLVEDLISTEVVFRQLSPEEIWRYIQTGEPVDKAGSYGIQGAGGSFVERIQGSYSNVVGLPVAEVGHHIRSFGLLP